MWYADEVKKQMDASKQAADVKVDMPLSMMRKIGAQWLVAHMKASSDTVINGFKKAGIYQAIQDPHPFKTPKPFRKQKLILFLIWMKIWTSMSL